MSVSSLGGLWKYPSSLSPDHDDFMFIDEERRRIITYIVRKCDPLYWGPMRLWYQPESADSISVRLRLENPWRPFSFELRGDQISWTFGEKDIQVWRCVPWTERPDWLDERLAKDYAKMDEAEKCT